LLLPGETTYTAPEWANLTIAALMQHDWGIPCAIISDRDAKFLSSFWRTVFRKLGTNLLFSTAYHPQTDGQSERTNQVVEIALRYYVTANPDEPWTKALPFIQATLNNSKNSSTNMSPNEVIYGFRTNDTLSLLADLPPEDFSRLRQIKREEAEEAIAFANVNAKFHYDKRHRPLTLQVGDEAYLRLHRGYIIPGVTNRKLSHQRIGPFRILRKVGPLAYHLNLPPTMKIHPIVSVAQLEHAPGPDPYMRPRPTNPPPVEVENPGAEDEPSYEIERLIRHRHKGAGANRRREYLAKWKGYGNEHNAYYDTKDLSEAKELVEEYDRKHKLQPM
jgi:hypothetical protein